MWLSQGLLASKGVRGSKTVLVMVSLLRKRYRVELAPVVVDEAVTVEFIEVACWQPDSFAPGASHDVGGGGGIVKVSSTKSAWSSQRKSLERNPASEA